MEILVGELAGIERPDALRFGISVATTLPSLAYAHFQPLNGLFGLAWKPVK